jgi:hypothetical protein
MDGGRDDGPWLGRYRALFPIRSRGAFHVVAATTENGSARVVVVGAPSADRARVRTSLAEIVRVHALLDSPLIPRVSDHGEHEGTPFVELDADAIADGHELLRLTAESGTKLPYGQADALFTQMRIAMQAAHRAIDPISGEPVCLGRVSLGNFLFNRRGQVFVVGFGHNFVLARENGLLDGTCAVYQAAEVALGEPATPSGDYVAVLLAARSLVTFADAAMITERVLTKGAIRAENLELFQAVRYFDTEWISQVPAMRPPIEEGIAKTERIRRIIDTTVDVEGLRTTAARLLEQHQPAIEHVDAPVRTAQRLTVARDGAWIEAGDGTRERLGRSHSLLLSALVEKHLAGAGQPLDVWTLLAIGWPGEEPMPEAGANRVYVALTRLRKSGLRDVLERSGDGYRLHPSTIVRRV